MSLLATVLPASQSKYLMLHFKSNSSRSSLYKHGLQYFCTVILQEFFVTTFKALVN